MEFSHINSENRSIIKNYFQCQNISQDYIESNMILTKLIENINTLLKFFLFIKYVKKQGLEPF